MYILLKFVHVAAALLSIVGFSVRGYLKIIGSSRLDHQWLRIAPHVIDTVLLLSAVILAVELAKIPFVDVWLTAKIVALVVYILLGFIVMRLAKRQAVRVVAYILAIITFSYIVMVALSRNVFLF
ncbi:MAG: SirB2 family protein [Gammaproteobacteria bacterium]|nr:SirB2 family protein [Gammaproteobacteria bacterium]